jgi:hypothetical protein
MCGTSTISKCLITKGPSFLLQFQYQLLSSRLTKDKSSWRMVTREYKYPYLDERKENYNDKLIGPLYIQESKPIRNMINL